MYLGANPWIALKVIKITLKCSMLMTVRGTVHVIHMYSIQYTVQYTKTEMS